MASVIVGKCYLTAQVDIGCIDLEFQIRTSELETAPDALAYYSMFENSQERPWLELPGGGDSERPQRPFAVIRQQSGR